ncbi:glycosyltransferase [Flavobacterium sp.]|uniref:glycosyltransferase n=1 Tax=Flavobacterium sp. TaxID=239 RepID=UPI003751BB4D
MKTLVISSSPIIVKDNQYYAYSPYVNELEIWAKYSSSISFSCPIWYDDKGLLISKINFPIESITPIDEFNMKSFSGIIKGFQHLFSTLFKLFSTIKKTEHLHLRCPGNIALLGCIVQILFPNKYKTAKYAGNWDPKSSQPISYKLQKFILENTFITKNCKVLVYGKWKNSSKNIKSFFTATYLEKEKEPILDKTLDQVIQFTFVGTLVKGKRPLYAIKLVEKLKSLNKNVQLSLYGNGYDNASLQEYCEHNNLKNTIIFKGNQPKDVIKKAYQESHFVILPSKSEGWPKAIAEGMFWGALPIATNISCVSYMLNNNKRGIMLTMNLEKDVEKISALLNNEISYNEKRNEAIEWSRQFTVDYFESEIKLLLKA